jgi:hypothetical protein
MRLAQRLGQRSLVLLKRLPLQILDAGAHFQFCITSLSFSRSPGDGDRESRQAPQLICDDIQWIVASVGAGVVRYDIAQQARGRTSELGDKRY